MTPAPDDPDLLAIAAEAEVELLAAGSIQALDMAPGEGINALYVAELGYYEAELTSLRDAATTLDAADQGRNAEPA